MTALRQFSQGYNEALRDMVNAYEEGGLANMFEWAANNAAQTPAFEVTRQQALKLRAEAELEELAR